MNQGGKNRTVRFSLVFFIAQHSTLTIYSIKACPEKGESSLEFDNNFFVRYIFGNHAHMSVSLTNCQIHSTVTNSHKHSCTLDWGFSTNVWVPRIKQHITMTTCLKKSHGNQWLCTVCFCKTGSTLFCQIVYLLFASCSHVSMCFWFLNFFD
jgi:hypothetical protein